MNAKLIIINASVAERACGIIRSLPHDVPHSVVIAPHRETRSGIQNSRMWAMLSDVARQVEWHGLWLSKDEWKDMVTAALKRQRVVPGIDGGFVVLGTSTRKMTIGEMNDVIDFLFAFGAERGVVWGDPTQPEEL